MKKLLSGALAGTLAVISSGLMTIHAAADENVEVNETNFPDAVFRDYVSKNFDTNSDGVLSLNECRAASVIDFQHTDCSECTSLKGIEYFPYLDQLLCFDGKISSLDISRNTYLRTVSLYNLPLGSVDVSKNVNLTLLGCDKLGLTQIDVSSNTELETFSCMENELTSVDITNNTKLVSFRCSSNKITSLDLSKNPRLYSLQCEENLLMTLDVSNNPSLHTLWCSDNKLTSLDLSKNTALDGTSSVLRYNTLNIGEETTEFDLTLLEPYGFDISKASGWDGATLDGKKLKKIMGMVSYTYNTGSKPTTFYLYCRDPADISPSGNTDPSGKPIVWVNGKDVKDRSDESKSVYHKTYNYQNTGMFSGGKWCVAVTKSDIATVEAFTALFTDGKLNAVGKTAATDGKKLASAKIKDGTITVTAGKEAGTANVWLYEVKGKAVVNDSVTGVVPKATAISVRMASGSPILAETLTNGVSKTGVTKLELKPGESKTLLLGDKKAAFDTLARFTMENSGTDTASAVLTKNELTVTALKEGNANITITCDQSGKKVKLSLKCKE